MTLARKIAVNASLLAGGRLLNAAMGIVGVGVATRYLGLSDYGVLVAVTAFATTVGALFDLGLWTVGAREIAKRPDETQRIVGAILTVGVAIAFVGGAVAVGLAFVVYPGADNEVIRRGILILLVSLPLAAPSGAASAYFISQQRAYMGMLGSLLASVVTLGGLVLASTLDWGLTGVFLCYVAAAVLQSALMIALAAGRVRLVPVLDAALGRQLLRWALPLGGAMLIHQLYWRVDMVMLSRLDTRAEVALYGLSFKMLDAVIVLPSFVLVTLMPEFARLANQRERFESVMQKAFSVMQVATVAVVVVFVGFASEIVRIVGGPQFAAATPVLQILMLAVAFSYFGGLLSQGFIAHNRQNRLLWISAVALPVNVVLNLALIPLLGARGAAAAFALSEGLILAALAWLYRGFARFPRPHLLPRVAAAGCAMASVALLKLFAFVDSLSPVLVLLAGASLALAVYVAALYALRAMPRELHASLVTPVWARLRPQ